MLNPTRKDAWPPGRAALLVCALTFVFVLGLRQLPKFQHTEFLAYDALLRWKARTAVQEPRIVLVEMTEADLIDPRLPDWPLSDGHLAQLLEIIEDHQPRVIGLDQFRDIPVPKANTDQFHRLSDVLLTNANIVCIFRFPEAINPGIPPPPVLRDVPDRVGFNDIAVDDQIDKIVRRGLLFQDDGTNQFQSFAMNIASIYLAHEGVQMEAVSEGSHCFRLGKTIFCPIESHHGAYCHLDAGGFQFLMDFKLPARLTSFTLAQALAGKIPADALRDKIVLIGTTAQSVKDYNVTPVRTQHRGLDLHALMINQLLRAALDGEQPLRAWPEPAGWTWILVWCMVGSAIGYWIRSPWGTALLMVVSVTVLGVVTSFCFARGWWVISAAPATGLFVAAFFVFAYASYFEKMERGLIMRLFSQNVSPEVADAIWQQRDMFLEGGRPRAQKMVATVLYTDLKEFTPLTEKLDPAVVMEWLNEYMAAMAKVIADHRGVIDKFIGDAIMALFGVPLVRETESLRQADAVAAVRCALAMERALTQLNAQWQQQGLPTCSMRVGIHTGPLVSGSLGTADRMEYTVIGDTVNTAARLESYGKEVAAPDRCCQILIGDSTWEYVREQFQTESVGTLNLRGKQKLITIHRVLAEKPV